jgi:superfamily II DNA/RNA helicase
MKPTIIRVDDFEKGMPINDNEAMDYLAEKVKKHYKSEKWNKTIIFVDGKPNATELCRKLNKSVPCFVYTSDTIRDKEVERDMVDFTETNERPAKVMIAVDMVSEGFDVKDIETKAHSFFEWVKENFKICE